jgi:hypothetical protein
MVNHGSTHPTPEPILKLQRQLEHFRSSQPVRTKLPESLWPAIQQLCAEPIDQGDSGVPINEAVSGTARESRMIPNRRYVDVNLDELDRVLDGARETPLSEADCEKVKTALHALAAMLVRPRNTEKTNAAQSG